MAGHNGKRHTTYQTLAVTLVLGCLFPSVTCFNMKWASNSVEHNKPDSVAAALEVRTGSIVVNGKDFESQSVSAAQNRGPTHVDSDHLDGTGVSEWTLELEDPTVNEATLRQMNASLHCGENTMTLKVTGPRAADLEIDMGDAQPMLLTEVPETCGLSLQQNAQFLTLVVSTKGCNVRKENGNYVLSIKWHGTPLNLTCPIHPTPGAQSALATSDPAEKPGKPNYPHKPWNMYPRKRRHVKQYSVYDFGNPMYPISVTRAPAATVSTTAKPQQMPPFAYKYSPYYYYYYYYYYPYYPYYPYYHPYFQSPKGGPPFPTTTASTSTSTPMMPQKPSNLCNPYPPATHPFSAMYYEFMQHCYGKQPYVVPTTQIQTTEFPPYTNGHGKQPYVVPTRPVQTTEFAPYTKGPTPVKTVTTTRKPTTTTTTTTAKTTKRCKFFRPAGNHQILKPYESYEEKPFDLFFSEKFNHDDNAEKGKYMPRAAYNPTDSSQAHPHPGFEYWPPVPWLPQEP